MWFLQLLVLLALYSVGPGLFFLRRARLAPLEKLAASVGLSFFLVYLASFAWYLSGLGHRWHAAISLACLALTLLSFRDLGRLLARRGVRRAVAAFGLFLVWALVLLSFVKFYGGGTWSGDWLEQYQRTVFFLNRRPPETLMIGLYPLPARPPMMNLVTASLLAQAGPQYEVFQVVYLFLNALVFLPVCLVARNLIRRSGRRLPWVLLLLLAASPMVAQNLTYAWSKLFTAFYVLLGTHLYLRGWRKGSRTYTVMAFASLCAGFIVHHSAGPYALFLGLHYVTAVFWRRRHKWAEAAAIGAVSVLILATWFGWSARTYGAKRAFASNSTVTDSAAMSAGENARNIGKNVLNTIVPRVLQNPSIMRIEDLEQASAAGRVRDFTFLIYQVSLTFGVGSLGAAAIGVLLYRSLRRPAGEPMAPTLTAPPVARRERRFWLGYALVVFVAGVAVYGGVDRFGVAHICLQGLVLLGLAFLAAGFRLLTRGTKALLVAGLVLDLGLGILLHVTLESQDVVTVHPDRTISLWGDAWPARAAQFNWQSKMAPGAKVINPDGRGDTDPLLNQTLSFWGDRFVDLVTALQFATVVLFAVIAWLALRPRRTAAAGRPEPPVLGQAGRHVPRRKSRARR